MFNERLCRIKFTCGISPLNRCFKRHPLQLSSTEVWKIKRLFSDPEKVCWPSASLYYHGLRHTDLFIAQSTFYKYVNALGLKRKFPKPIKKTEGLKATQPNQYLHVDTTEWPVNDGIKLYFVFVSDNFSRTVLGANVALNKGAENVRQAVHQAIGAIHRFHPEHTCVTLVSDDGGENKALTVRELVAQCTHPRISQVIAQKDIAFSNSPVEAINRIFKRYLRHHKPTTLQAGQKVLALFLEDYGFLRPHGSLHGLTPMEAYTGPFKTLDFEAQKQKAKQLRLEQNRQNGCETCL